LTEALIHYDRRLQHVGLRLRDALRTMSSQAEGGSHVELLPVTGAVIAESLAVQPIPDPTDNLILACIRCHGRLNVDEPKALLSGNSRHFGTAEVRELLSAAGIERYFSSLDACLGWVRAELAGS
jgi:hypothetical protein